MHVKTVTSGPYTLSIVYDHKSAMYITPIINKHPLLI